MNDDGEQLMKEVRAERANRAKALGGRKELVRRIAALSPEAIVETMLGAYFTQADRFIEDAEQHNKHLKFEKLNRESERLLERNKTAQGKAYYRNSERIAEIFDEMDLLDGEGIRTPLSKKYQRLAEIQSRLAEREVKP
jgi:hypothetical protein